MPSIADYLRQFAKSASAKTPQLEAELRNIEARKREIEAELKAAHLALNRANKFIVASGPDRYCPYCCVIHDRQSTLRAVPSSDPHLDLFRCNHCVYQYEI